MYLVCAAALHSFRVFLVSVLVVLCVGLGLQFIPGVSTSDAAVISCSGTVYKDVAVDGIQDLSAVPAESGLSGVIVSLYSGDSYIPFQVLETDASGVWSVDLPEGGEYIAEITPPSGLVAGATGSDSFTTVLTFSSSDCASTYLSTGLVDPPSCTAPVIEIGDRVFIDENANGMFDTGDTPVVGATVNLYDEVGTALISSTVTDTQGQWFFRDIEPGVGFVVKLDNPSDYSAMGSPLFFTTGVTSAHNGSTMVQLDSDATLPAGVYGVDTFPVVTVDPLAAGVSNHALDFGLLPPVGVGDYVWVDLNQDGVQDIAERPMVGVEVTLVDYGADGAPGGGDDLTETNVTDDTGHYFFVSHTAPFSLLQASRQYRVFIDPNQAVFQVGGAFEDFENVYDLDGNNDGSAETPDPLSLLPSPFHGEYDFGYWPNFDLELLKTHEGGSYDPSIIVQDGHSTWNLDINSYGPAKAQPEHYPVTVIDVMPYGENSTDCSILSDPNFETIGEADLSTACTYSLSPTDFVNFMSDYVTVVPATGWTCATYSDQDPVLLAMQAWKDSLANETIQTDPYTTSQNLVLVCTSNNDFSPGAVPPTNYHVATVEADNIYMGNSLCMIGFRQDVHIGPCARYSRIVIRNSAWLTYNNGYPDASNRNDYVINSVQMDDYDLTIEKSLLTTYPPFPTFGDPLTFQLDVTNNGLSSATVNVDDGFSINSKIFTGQNMYANNSYSAQFIEFTSAGGGDPAGIHWECKNHNVNNTNSLANGIRFVDGLSQSSYAESFLSPWVEPVKGFSCILRGPGDPLYDGTLYHLQSGEMAPPLIVDAILQGYNVDSFIGNIFAWSGETYPTLNATLDAYLESNSAFVHDVGLSEREGACPAGINANDVFIEAWDTYGFKEGDSRDLNKYHCMILPELNSVFPLSDNADLDTSSNSSSSSYEFSLPDLRLYKYVDSGAPGVGQDILYRLEVQNEGIGDFTNPTVTVEDYIPYTQDFVAVVSPGWTCSITGDVPLTAAVSGTYLGVQILPSGQTYHKARILSCSYSLAGPLPAGTGLPPLIIQTKFVDTYIYNAEDASDIHNRACIVGTTGELLPLLDTENNRYMSTYDRNWVHGNAPIPAWYQNNCIQIRFGSSNTQDLSINKTVASPGPYQFGDIATYTLTIQNHGPQVDAPIVIDTLPGELVYVVGSESSPDFDFVQTGQRLEWTWTGAGTFGGSSFPVLPAGVTTITFQAQIVSDALPSIRNYVYESSTVDGVVDPSTNSNISFIDILVDQTDVELMKSHIGDTTFTIGDTVVWTLVVHNYGPAPVRTSVRIGDTLPAGVSYVSASTGWTCNASGQDVTCQLDSVSDIPSGGDLPQLQLTTVLTGPFDDPNTLENTGFVSTSSHDPEEDSVHPNFDSDIISVVGPDLEVVKTPLVATPNIGGTALFQIDVGKNVTFFSNEPVVEPITFVDTFPIGIVPTGFGVLPEFWSCSISGQDVTCVFDDGNPTRLGTGSLGVITLEGLVVNDLALIGTTLNNCVDVLVKPNEVSATNNISCASVTLAAPSPDLSISKTTITPPSEQDFHRPLLFDITVHNHGPGVGILQGYVSSGETVAPVVVDDTLPTGLTLVSVDGGSDWSCTMSGNSFACTYVGVNVGQGMDTATIHVQTMVELTARPLVVNTAKIRANDATLPQWQGEGNNIEPNSDTASASFLRYCFGNFVWEDVNEDGVQDPTETPISGVEVDLTWYGPDGVSGTSDDVVFTVTTTDTGGVYGYEALPSGKYTAVVNTSTLPAGYVPTWDLDSGLSSPDNQILFALDAESLTPGVFIRTDVDFGYVKPDASIYDLGLVKVLSSLSADGTQATYTIRATNQGNVSSGHVEITDSIPEGLTFVSATNGGNFDDITGTVSWSIDDIAVGSSVDLQIVLSINDMTFSPFVNSAFVSADSGDDIDSDPSDMNNELVDKYDIDNPNSDDPSVDTDDHDIAQWVPDIAIYDLALIKQVEDTPAGIGDVVTYTMSVFNQGNRPVSHIAVNDFVPDGLVFVDQPDWVFDPATGDVSYTFDGVLNPGETVVFALLLQVGENANESNITNYAEIKSFTDPEGNPVVDIDSLPDSEFWNDLYEDDRVDGFNGDEDDNDAAVLNLHIVRESVLPHTGINARLFVVFALALLLFGVFLRRKKSIML